MTNKAIHSGGINNVKKLPQSKTTHFKKFLFPTPTPPLPSSPWMHPERSDRVDESLANLLQNWLLHDNADSFVVDSEPSELSFCFGKDYVNPQLFDDLWREILRDMKLNLTRKISITTSASTTSTQITGSRHLNAGNNNISQLWKVEDVMNEFSKVNLF